MTPDLSSSAPPTAASSPDLAALQALTLAVEAQDAAIDALFTQYQCEHAYLDVGTNLGVQIRRLYEPTKYAKSLVLPRTSSAPLASSSAAASGSS